MSWPRVLEPEIMDTPAEAADYDRMDHAEVNRAFVLDLLAAGLETGNVLDVGTGTARIPIELCRSAPEVRIWAIDLAPSMLALGARNVAAAGLTERILLEQVDAKKMPYASGQFAAVISNSIVHHIPQPRSSLSEAVRVTAPGGLLFFRDLMRPPDQPTWKQLVQQHAGHEQPHARQMFADSLRAALTLEEIRAIVHDLGFAAETVRATSDRHWTWCARMPHDALP